MRKKEECKLCGRKITETNKSGYCGRCKMELRNKGIAVGGVIIATGVTIAKAITGSEDND